MDHKTLKALFLSLSFFTAVFTVVVSFAETVTWSEELRLTTHRTYDISPSIFQMIDGKVWVVWQSSRDGNMELYYKKYNGVWPSGTWSTPKDLTYNASQDMSPAIAQTPDATIWVVWVSDRTGYMELFYKTSSDNGLSWTGDTQLTTDSYDDYTPSVTATVDGKLWIVWQRYLNSSNSEIYYTVFNGSSWSGETRLTYNPSLDRRPSVTQAIDGRIWVAWGRTEDGNFEIYYTVFNGSSWSGETRLTYNPDYSDGDPAIIQARNGSMWVVWVSREYKLTAYDNLYYTASPDYGSSWSPATMISENSTTDDNRPSIFQVNDERIWVVWSTDRDDDWEIYYKTSSIVTYHDVAITGVKPLSTVAYEGETVSINVTTENQGDFTESYTVTCYANSTPIDSQPVTLSAENSTTIVFEWNTSGYPFGTYTISANASSAANETLINTADNTLVDGTMKVKTPGDIDGDGQVNITDLTMLNDSYGSTPNDSNWNPEADINRDSLVNVLDLSILSKNYD